MVWLLAWMVVRLKSTNEKSIDNHNNASKKDNGIVRTVKKTVASNNSKQVKRWSVQKPICRNKIGVSGQETNQRVNIVKRTNR